MSSTRTWQVWVEGFVVTGESGKAQLMGETEAKTFGEACRIVFSKTREHAMYFDPVRLTYWGCRLFDNETDARRSFG